MLRKIFELLFSVIGGTIGYLLVDLGLYSEIIKIENTLLLVVVYLFFILIGFLLFYIISPKFIDMIQKFYYKAEKSLKSRPSIDIAFGAIGLLFGLILAFFISRPLAVISIPVIGNVVIALLTVVIYIILAALGIRLALEGKDELLNLFNRDKKAEKIIEKFEKKETSKEANESEKRGGRAKILDTSVIIDGRIHPIVETKFIEGPLVIPEFVLEELQFIADSADSLKRERGRRGLDIVNNLQQSSNINVIITDKDYDKIKEVDIKLLKLAKDYDGMVVTNDYNLNKLALVQDIDVLNINELANAVKTIVIPGEEMMVNIIKEGKEKNQGLAYLEDGTMIVVENGKDLIGQDVHVVVTTVFQTSAGKMIFTKPYDN